MQGLRRALEGVCARSGVRAPWVWVVSVDVQVDSVAVVEQVAAVDEVASVEESVVVDGADL